MPQTLSNDWQLYKDFQAHWSERGKFFIISLIFIETWKCQIEQCVRLGPKRSKENPNSCEKNHGSYMVGFKRKSNSATPI